LPEVKISFELTKLLSLLVYPLTQALLLCLLGVLLIRLGYLRSASVTVLLACGWLYLCSTALFADFLMGTLEKGYTPRSLSVIEKADAIVVLGGATRGDTHLSTHGDLNQQADRLLYAVELYRAGKAPVVLASGGGAPGDRPEAELMEGILHIMGVPPRDILRESASRTTYDNARYSAILLQGKGLRRVLLVTSAFHMRRALGVFRQTGLDVVPAPTDYQRLVGRPVVPRWLPTADDLVRSTYALREHVGYWVYRYRGWL
jgi:uncharacterized SAM-binding protein YcdF (DUF218 family)